jgi:oligoribonuclease
MEPLIWPLVWVDLEMTGLDPDTDRILEIAVIVTDGQLERIVEGPDLVVSCPEGPLSHMDPVVQQMHAASGLTDAVRASSLSVGDAEAQVMAFLREHVAEAGAAPLAGNSVHADRAFLRRYMPAIESFVHYRNVDVSTVKELARRWHPEALAQAPRKGGGHRALADIRESIDEMRYWRRAVFKDPPPAAVPAEEEPPGV